MSEFSTALNAIIAAELPPATLQVTLKLLNGASESNGQYNLTMPDYLALTGCTNLNAAKKHLTILSKLKIIHFSTNEHVYVTFLAWMQPTDEAKMARVRAENGACTRQNEAEEVRIVTDDAPNRRVHAPKLQRVDAPNPPPIPPPSWVELSIDLDQDPDLRILNSTQPPTPLTGAGEWVVDLLTDPAIDLQPDNAKDIARLHTAAYVVKHVATWWPKRKEESPGVLVYRLLKAHRRCRPNPHPPDEFLESDFWRTHYDHAAELAAVDPLLVEGLPRPIHRTEDRAVFTSEVLLG